MIKSNWIYTFKSQVLCSKFQRHCLHPMQRREVLYSSLPSSFVVVLMFTLKMFRFFIFIYILTFWNWVTVSRCGFLKNWSYSASVGPLNPKSSRSFLQLFLAPHFLHFPETSVSGIFGFPGVVFLSYFLHYNFGFSLSLLLDLWPFYSQFVCGSSSPSLTWELVKNVELQAAPQNYWIRIFINKIPR